MPNWCMNTLTVSGDAAELKKFVESSMGLPAQYLPQEWEKKLERKPEVETKPYFCFNALIPVPDSVLQIGFDGHDKLPKDALMLSMVGCPFEPIDGYHWSIANWGTKWDIYHDHITADDMGWCDGCESIECEFDTAWSPPIAWFMTVTDKFPSLDFKLHYEEPGCYFAGDLIYEDGELTDVEYDAQQCAETFAYLLDEESAEYEEEKDLVALDCVYTR